MDLPRGKDRRESGGIREDLDVDGGRAGVEDHRELHGAGCGTYKVVGVASGSVGMEGGLQIRGSGDECLCNIELATTGLPA
jgi:hypothetical protein